MAQKVSDAGIAAGSYGSADGDWTRMVAIRLR